MMSYRWLTKSTIVDNKFSLDGVYTGKFTTDEDAEASLLTCKDVS